SCRIIRPNAAAAASAWRSCAASSPNTAERSKSATTCPKGPSSLSSCHADFYLVAEAQRRGVLFFKNRSLRLRVSATGKQDFVSKASVLIVDDEPGVRSALSGVLRDEGYDVEAVDSGEACIDRVVRGLVDVIVLDVWLPGLDGLATLGRLRQMKIDSQVVVISGHGNIESAVKAIKMGAFDFVEKPLSLEKTVLVIRNALRQRHLEAENRALRARVAGSSRMVGESLLMRQL